MSTAPVGSKANPSQYDCYPDLAEDEPYFVIRAHDPLSSALVELHAYIGGPIGRGTQQARRDHEHDGGQCAAPIRQPEISRDLRHLAVDGAMARPEWLMRRSI